MIAITCPAGQVTAILVPRLLRRGHPVRVLGRSSRDLDRLMALGAQVRRGDLLVRADLDRWLREAVASCLTIPITSDPRDELRIARELACAHAASSVAHLVLFSVAGAERVGAESDRGSAGKERSGAGLAPSPLAIKAEIEQIFADCGRDLTCLRTGLRMEILGHMRQELESGWLPLPVPTTAPLPMVAAQDVAQAALHFLARGPAGGERIALLGPELITPEAMAAELGAAWGHRIQAIEVSPADWRRRLVETGLPPERAQHLTDLIAHLAAAVADPAALTPDAESAPVELAAGTRFADFAPFLAGVPPPAPARY